MEKKFNIGDRVRFIRDYDNECVYVDKGDCGTVESIDTNFGIRIVLDSPERISIFDTDYIEPITPIDPKTAFLSELRGLLERYDAKISAYSAGYDGELDLTFNVGDIEVLYSDENPIFKGHSVHTVTASNIMDYDKE